jgi:hypothetical protein
MRSLVALAFSISFSYIWLPPVVSHYSMRKKFYLSPVSFFVCTPFFFLIRVLYAKNLFLSFQLFVYTDFWVFYTQLFIFFPSKSRLRKVLGFLWEFDIYGFMTKSHLKSLIKECVQEVLSSQSSFRNRFPDLYDTVDPLPLKDGVYDSLRYGYSLEINGHEYKTKGGVRCGREHCGGPKKVKVSSGVAREIG